MNSLFRRGKFLLLLALALAISVPGTAVAQLSEQNDLPGESPTFEVPADTEAVPEQIIVKFNENVGPAAKADVRRAEGLEKEKELELIGAEVDKVTGRSVEAAISDLNARPDVEYAERDYVVHAADFADEPRFAELWGLHNPLNDVDVNGLEASDTMQGDPNLVVAVIDTGVDFTHPDLTDRRWVNPGESGGGKETNGIDDDGNGFVDDVNGADFFNDDGDPFDDHSHGTHVSGTIAASVNDQGVVGVAPNVKIMALKFLDANGSGFISDGIEALQYATNKGVTISNNSWGCYCFSQALEDSIEASEQLFVAAAGNDANDNDLNPFYPASFDSQNILSVAAVDRQGNMASFSNLGANSVDISAPGVDILSSVPGDFWGLMSGTSMAAPHAAGVAALAASVDPALLSDPVALKNHVMDTGKPVPATAGFTVTGDMVDAEAAVGGGSAPANDNFADSQLVSGATASVSGTTHSATREDPGEPDHYTSNPADADWWLGDHTVWYSWKAPDSGSTTIDTCQANIDSILAVYTGAELNNLSRVADNNNDFCGGGWGSKVTFEAQGGTTYRIAVGDAGGLRENTFTLKLSGPAVQAPRVTSTDPVDNATRVAPGANISATFSEAMMGSSLTSTTFKLMKAGTTTTIDALLTYEPTTKKAILNPNSNLRLGTKYKAVVATGAKDLAGNRLDQNSSQSGLQQKSWTFTTRN